MAEGGVLKYLSAQNRPYSATDIFMNLHKEFGKSAVQKALDNLVKNGSIKEKEYGKQKVYCVLQSSSLSDEDMKQELNNLSEKVKQLSEKLSNVEQELRSSEAVLKSMRSTLTPEGAAEQQKILQEKVLKLSARLKNLSENGVKISKEERDEIMRKHELYTKEWRKRKSSCVNVIDSIAEGYPKSKKELFEELGIETDEAVGVSPPPPQNTLWKKKSSA